MRAEAVVSAAVVVFAVVAADVVVVVAAVVVVDVVVVVAAVVDAVAGISAPAVLVVASPNEISVCWTRLRQIHFSPIRTSETERVQHVLPPSFPSESTHRRRRPSPFRRPHPRSPVTDLLRKIFDWHSGVPHLRQLRHHLRINLRAVPRFDRHRRTSPASTVDTFDPAIVSAIFSATVPAKIDVPGKKRK